MKLWGISNQDDAGKNIFIGSDRTIVCVWKKVKM